MQRLVAANFFILGMFEWVAAFWQILTILCHKLHLPDAPCQLYEKGTENCQTALGWMDFRQRLISLFLFFK